MHCMVSPQFYSDGVLDIPNCSRSKLTHALLVVGYGYSHSKDYWLVKNRYGHWQSGLD